MQIYANLHSTGFSVGLVGIFHKEAAILSLLYFGLVSGRHNPFSKAWQFIIRHIIALTKGDRQHEAVRPAAGHNRSQAGRKTIPMPPGAMSLCKLSTAGAGRKTVIRGTLLRFHHACLS